MNTKNVCFYWMVAFLAGTTTAQPEPHAYHFSLHQSDIHVCDATLITPNNLLVPATCVYTNKDNPSLYNIDYSFEQGDRIEVSSIAVHPNYLETSYDYDVAVLTTAEPVPAYGTPIQFATTEPNSGQDAEFTGWGWYTTDAEKSYFPLFTNDVTIISNDECSLLLNSAPSKPSKLTKRMLCSKNKPYETTCVSDLGSPLVSDNVLYGMMSWTTKQCFTGTTPGVFSDISQYSDWINSQIINSVLVAGVATQTMGVATGIYTSPNVVVAQQNQAAIYG